jgi:hypothetical protein
MAAAAALAAVRLWTSADAQQAAPGGLGIRPAPAQGRPGSEGVRDARSLDQKALGMYEVCAEGCSAECAEYQHGTDLRVELPYRRTLHNPHAHLCAGAGTDLLL